MDIIGRIRADQERRLIVMWRATRVKFVDLGYRETRAGDVGGSRVFWSCRQDASQLGRGRGGWQGTFPQKGADVGRPRVCGCRELGGHGGEHEGHDGCAEGFESVFFSGAVLWGVRVVVGVFCGAEA